MCLAYYMSAVGSCRCRQPRTITDFSWSNSATIAFLLWHTIYLGLLVQCNFAGDIKGVFRAMVFGAGLMVCLMALLAHEDSVE